MNLQGVVYNKKYQINIYMQETRLKITTLNKICDANSIEKFKDIGLTTDNV